MSKCVLDQAAESHFSVCATGGGILGVNLLEAMFVFSSSLRLAALVYIVI